MGGYAAHGAENKIIYRGNRILGFFSRFPFAKCCKMYASTLLTGMPSSEAAIAPVHAPVPGRGIPTKSAKASACTQTRYSGREIFDDLRCCTPADLRHQTLLQFLKPFPVLASKLS